jgi:hypothetical protein
MLVKVGTTHECLEIGSEADGSSHAEVTAGPETLEKLQMLSVREAALLTAGIESYRKFSVPSKDGFWEFSIGKKGVMKIYETDNSLSLRTSITSRFLASGNH